MQLIADLAGETDTYLSAQLSDMLQQRGGQGCEHLSEAFGRMRSKYISVAERGEMEEVVGTFLAQYGAERGGVVEQWGQVRRWWAQRTTTALARPLGGRRSAEPGELERLREALCGPEYDGVRAAALFLISAARDMVDKGVVSAPAQE